MVAIDIYRQKLTEQIQNIDSQKILNKIDLVLKSIFMEKPFMLQQLNKKNLFSTGLNDFENGNYFT